MTDIEALPGMPVIAMLIAVLLYVATYLSFVHLLKYPRNWQAPSLSASVVTGALAALTVNLSSGPDVVISDLTIREDSGSAIVDIFRVDTEETQTFAISEAEFSGNQSPWRSGIYGVQNEGEVNFAAGQRRARLTISMRSNPVREPDRDVVRA